MKNFSFKSSPNNSFVKHNFSLDQGLYSNRSSHNFGSSENKLAKIIIEKNRLRKKYEYESEQTANRLVFLRFEEIKAQKQAEKLKRRADQLIQLKKNRIDYAQEREKVLLQKQEDIKQQKFRSQFLKQTILDKRNSKQQEILNYRRMRAQQIRSLSSQILNMSQGEKENLMNQKKGLVNLGHLQKIKMRQSCQENNEKKLENIYAIKIKKLKYIEDAADRALKLKEKQEKEEMLRFVKMRDTQMLQEGALKYLESVINSNANQMLYLFTRFISHFF